MTRIGPGYVEPLGTVIANVDKVTPRTSIVRKMRNVQIRIVGTRTEVPNSLLSRSHTVLRTQVYTVELKLPHRTLLSEHRYSEFRSLHLSVAAKQMPSATCLIAPFPKPVLVPLKAAVVEERKLALEGFMTETIASPQLGRILLVFLGLSVEEIDALLAPPSPPCASTPLPKLSAIQSLHFRLRTSPNNRLQALIDFDMCYFQRPELTQSDAIRSLLGDVVPLAGDNVCGTKALAVLSKLVTTGVVKKSHEFRSELLRLSVDLLRGMHLDKHLKGEFPGGSYEEAFTVAALLDQGLGQSAMLVILSGSQEAYMRLKAWRAREMLEAPEKTIRKHSDEWREADCSLYPGLSIQYQCDEEGCLHLAIALRIEATPQRVAECVLNPEIRHQWDKWLLSMDHLRRFSETCTVTSYVFDYDFQQVSVLTYIEQKAQPSGLLLNFRRISDPNLSQNILSSSPFLCSYSLVPLAGTAGCQVLYQARHTEDFRRFLTQDLVEERNMLKSIWWRLKQMAEEKSLPGDLPGLSQACDRKILRRKEKRHQSAKETRAVDRDI